jgi:hypothetical protein
VIEPEEPTSGTILIDLSEIVKELHEINATLRAIHAVMRAKP